MQKKIIAVVLAVAMMLSLVPMAAFAASTNNVTRVVTVGKDADVGALATVPVLKIENKDETWGGNEVFRLRLPSAAEWYDVAAFTDGEGADITDNNGAYDVVVKYITDQVIQIELTADAEATQAAIDEYVLSVPMLVEFDDADGEMKVTIDQMDSALTGGSYAFAIAASGATVITVGSVPTVQRGEGEEGADIIIDETVVGSFGEGEQEFRIRLPRGFEWDEDETGIEFSNLDVSDELLDADGRDLLVSFVVNNESVIRGSIVIKPVFEVTKSAATGEVLVDITNRDGDLTSKYGVKIANYKTFNIKVDIDEVEEFYAGRIDDDFVTAEVEISEDIANSLMKGRVIDFELPEWVALYDDVKIYVNDVLEDTIAWDDGDNDFFEVNDWEFTVPKNIDKKMTITFELPLVAEASKSGDVVLKIDGAGIDEEEIVVAKAIAPVTMEVVDGVKNLEIGTRKQAASDILIKEAYAGALRDYLAWELDFEDDGDGYGIADRDDELYLVLAVTDGVGYVAVDDFEAEVIEGDLEIGDTDNEWDPFDVFDLRSMNAMAIEITADSSKPSTVKISGVEMTLDRTVPLGMLKLRATGDTMIDELNEDWDHFVDEQDYVKVTTPINDGTSKVPEVKFTIGQKTYYVAGAAMEADVAPFIQDARTMVAVRYIAYGLGVSPANVMYDGKDTVTILGDRIVQLKLGSNDLYVNGAVMKMDTAAVVKEGRTFVPIAWIARAMGVNYAWSDADLTVTFN